MKVLKIVVTNEKVPRTFFVTRTSGQLYQKVTGIFLSAEFSFRRIFFQLIKDNGNIKRSERSR